MVTRTGIILALAILHFAVGSGAIPDNEVAWDRADAVIPESEQPEVTPILDDESNYSGGSNDCARCGVKLGGSTTSCDTWLMDQSFVDLLPTTKSCQLCLERAVFSCGKHYSSICTSKAIKSRFACCSLDSSEYQDCFLRAQTSGFCVTASYRLNPCCGLSTRTKQEACLIIAFKGLQPPTHSAPCAADGAGDLHPCCKIPEQKQRACFAEAQGSVDQGHASSLPIAAQRVTVGSNFCQTKEGQAYPCCQLWTEEEQDQCLAGTTPFPAVPFCETHSDMEYPCCGFKNPRDQDACFARQTPARIRARAFCKHHNSKVHPCCKLVSTKEQAKCLVASPAFSASPPPLPAPPPLVTSSKPSATMPSNTDSTATAPAPFPAPPGLAPAPPPIPAPPLLQPTAAAIKWPTGITGGLSTGSSTLPPNTICLGPNAKGNACCRFSSTSQQTECFKAAHVSGTGIAQDSEPVR